MADRDESWKIGRRGGACAACSAALQAGQEAVSAIYAGRAPGPPPSGTIAPRTGPHGEDSETGALFERRDFCGPCFQVAEKRGSPYSWWSAVVPEPEKKKAVFDLGVAKEFLQRLLREEDPSRDSLRYLLALMLMRKRGVVLVGQSQTATGEVMVIRVPPDDETVHELKVVELDEAETERLREELGRLFAL